MIRHRAVQHFLGIGEPLINFRFVAAGDDQPERVRRQAHFGGDFVQRRLRLAVLRRRAFPLRSSPGPVNAHSTAPATQKIKPGHHQRERARCFARACRNSGAEAGASCGATK
jgi:hypothetical protein